MDIKQIFGQNVKKYRKANGYTQIQFAEILDVEQKHISFIESGNSFPSANLINKIVNTFNIIPKDLFEYAQSPSTDDLKQHISKMLENLSYDEISKIHNYVSFIAIKK